MTETITVIGVCAPERRRYARQAAAVLRRRLDIVRGLPHRAGDLSFATPHADASTGAAVTDVGTDLDLVHALQTLDRDASHVVCVVDARHMVDDLRDTAALVADATPGDPRGDVGARARQAALAIETATLVVLVNWEGVPTPDLSVQMALASHLNPSAGVRLSRGPREDLRSSLAAGPRRVDLLERAGWVRALNDEHDPYMTDRRVHTIRYEQLRPFHPGRLVRALDRIEEGAYGIVLRSVGFCRLATRPGILARWEHAGSAMWIDPLTADDGANAAGQDLALTGLGLAPHLISRALDAATLTDDELSAGPRSWSRFADPLPAWPALDAPRPDAT